MLPTWADWLERSLHKVRNSPGIILTPDEARVRDEVWAWHLADASRLLRIYGQLDPRGTVEPAIRVKLADWRQSLAEVLRLLNLIRASLPQPYQGTSRLGAGATIRIGCGNPGRLGCADFGGQRLVREPLTNPQTGVFQAMDILSLDVMGLTAPRLPSSFALPASCGYAIHAVGGPAYGSTAVIWRINTGVHVEVCVDVGGPRRLWVQVRGIGDVVWFCVLPLPTTSTSDADDAWCAELAGLDADLSVIFSNQGRPTRTLIAGDWNMQPDDLGGKREPRRRRQAAWVRLRDKWKLILHNTRMTGASEQILLPIRRRTLTIQEGSTHHGSGEGRAIDLAAGSPDLAVDFLLHNGISCSRTGACTWHKCVEFAGGDHFLMELVLPEEESGSPETASPFFPKGWRDAERWRANLLPGHPVLQAVALELDVAMSLVAGLRASAMQAQWVADTLAWYISVWDMWCRTAGFTPTCTWGAGQSSLKKSIGAMCPQMLMLTAWPKTSGGRRKTTM